MALRKHKEEDHQTQGQQLCIYCNKTFQKEIQLYSHMRSNHKERAQEDGVMDFSEDETYEDDADKYVPNHPEASQSTGEGKIKVLSNIAIPTKGQFIIDAQSGNNVLVATSTENINLEPSSEAEGLSNVASGIATSLAVLDTNAHLEGNDTYEEDLQSQYIEAAMADVHGEILKKEEEEEATEVVTKFITEEGSELELTAAQKAHLLEQLQGQEGQLSDNVVMVLDAGFEQAADVNNTSAESMDVDGQSQQSADDTVKNDDSTDELASMENASADEDSQQEIVQEQDASNDTEKTSDDKPANKLISALEGDWTEEDEESEEVTTKKTTKSHETKSDEKASVPAAKAKRTKRDETDASKTEKGNSDSAKNILDDWDSQEKFDEDSEKSATEEKTDVDTKSEPKSTESESKNGDKTEKKQSAQKNELKTLIASDWGDEDEEAF